MHLRLRFPFALAPFALLACDVDETTSTPLPAEVRPVVDTHRAATEAFCDLRYPDDPDAAELCVRGRALAVDGFPDGFAGCFELIAAGAADGLALYSAASECVAPYLETFNACLEAASTPSAAQICRETYRAAVDTGCLTSAEFESLRDEARGCGHCEAFAALHPGDLPPTYCLDTFDRS